MLKSIIDQITRPLIPVKIIHEEISETPRLSNPSRGIPNAYQRCTSLLNLRFTAQGLIRL